jgi:hypothetical protein
MFTFLWKEEMSTTARVLVSFLFTFGQFLVRSRRDYYVQVSISFISFRFSRNRDETLIELSQRMIFCLFYLLPLANILRSRRDYPSLREARLCILFCLIIGKLVWAAEILFPDYHYGTNYLSDVFSNHIWVMLYEYVSRFILGEKCLAYHPLRRKNQSSNAESVILKDYKRNVLASRKSNCLWKLQKLGRSNK